MFFPSDTTTEIVAHFLGYFQLATEDMRLRIAFEEIGARVAPQPASPDLEQVSADVTQKFSLGDYRAAVHYQPPHWLIHGEAAPLSPLGVATHAFAAPSHFVFPALPVIEGGEPTLAPALLAPQLGAEPGSLIAVIAQTISLSDNDVIILGEYDGPLEFHSGASDGIAAMHAAAVEINGFAAGTAGLSSIGDIPVFIDSLSQHAQALVAGSGDAQMSVTLLDDLTGTYLDGQLINEAPELLDALPAPWNSANENAPAAEPANHVALTGDAVVDVVTLKAGGNLLINEATLVNAGLNGSVVVVGGDVHELDAIIQVNAYLDNDTIDEGFPGAPFNGLGTTTTHNLATFVQETLHPASTHALSAHTDMPSNWQVSIVSGDMMFVQWLSQYTFVSDQDVAVLSSTGTTTLVTSGENMAFNSVGFADLGNFFDLIMVGGNLYDANIIVQTNVLYDNDTITMFSAEQGGNGTLNTSGNLLWNQASITNVGAVHYQHEVPDHFEQAMDGIASGDLSMPTGFSSDGLLEGIHLLKVLYIAGDVYDLRYVEQTNILGDADFVATQQASLLASQPQTQWDISTGSNALVNIATIIDRDSVGDTAFVGGSVYSDAILIQADILAADADDPSGDVLVTEVVAFLDIDIDLGSHDDLGASFALPDNDGPSPDIMHSVLT